MDTAAAPETRVTVGYEEWGSATVAFRGRERDSAEAEATALAQSVGFRRPEGGWRPVDPREVRLLIVRTLRLSFATDHEPVAEAEPKAERLADAFLGLVGDSLQAFTNGEWVEQAGTQSGITWSWTSATDSTFDGGVIYVGKDRSGLVWSQEED